ncbi:MAG: Fic family protein [Nitrospirota bacterium]
MIRYSSLDDLLEIHGRVLEETGGAEGVRDIGLLDSAIARPQAAFGGLDLYPTIPEKAAALIHSLIKNHP